MSLSYIVGERGGLLLVRMEANVRRHRTSGRSCRSRGEGVDVVLVVPREDDCDSARPSTRRGFRCRRRTTSGRGGGVFVREEGAGEVLFTLHFSEQAGVAGSSYSLGE